MSHSAISVRSARAADIPAIMRMKVELAFEDGGLDTVRAGEQDWQRDLFGAPAHFQAVLGECGGRVAGMAIYGEKFYPGWNGPTLIVHDLYVDAAARRRGMATALLRHIAGQAVRGEMPTIELNVRADNKARRFYSRSGFRHLHQCLTYTIAGPPLLQLADAFGDAAMA